MDSATPVLTSRPFVSLLVAFAGAFVYVLIKAYRARKIVNDLRKQGLVRSHHPSRLHFFR